MKLTEKSPNGTSFFGTVLVATVKQITTVLGRAQYDNNDGCDKTNFDWTAETNDGQVVTIYDWKYRRPLKMTEQVYFHIGGFNKDSTEKAKEEIESQINEVK
jgi:hypothetical protein